MKEALEQSISFKLKQCIRRASDSIDKRFARCGILFLLLLPSVVMCTMHPESSLHPRKSLACVHVLTNLTTSKNTHGQHRWIRGQQILWVEVHRGTFGGIYFRLFILCRNSLSVFHIVKAAATTLAVFMAVTIRGWLKWRGWWGFASTIPHFVSTTSNSNI